MMSRDQLLSKQELFWRSRRMHHRKYQPSVGSMSSLVLPIMRAIKSHGSGRELKLASYRLLQVLEVHRRRHVRSFPFLCSLKFRWSQEQRTERFAFGFPGIWLPKI